MRRIVATTAAVLLASGFPALQGRPDFSGEWRLDTASVAPGREGRGGGRPAARGDMSSGWGSLITVRQDDKQLVVEDRIFSRYDLQPPVRLVHLLDGSESVNSVMIGHTTHTRASRAAWKDQALEITTQYPGTHPGSGQPLTTEVVQRLRFESPDVLVVEVTRGTAGAPPTTTRAIYRRQTP